MIKYIIITLFLVVLFLLSIVMLYIYNDGPDKLTDYIKKKILAGRNANQKFKDLGYEMTSSNVYYKFKKVPVLKTHRVNGEDIITKDDATIVRLDPKDNIKGVWVNLSSSGGASIETSFSSYPFKILGTW